MISRSLVACLCLSATLIASPAFASEPAACAKPRFSDVGWTDITATTTIASQILQSLGYKPEVSVLSVAITFKALENGDRDIFLGNWMPLQEPTQGPLVKAGKVEVVVDNLKDARIGFATSRTPTTPASRPMPTSPSSRTNSAASSTASRPAAAPTIRSPR